MFIKNARRTTCAVLVVTAALLFIWNHPNNLNFTKVNVDFNRELREQTVTVENYKSFAIIENGTSSAQDKIWPMCKKIMQRNVTMSDLRHTIEKKQHQYSFTNWHQNLTSGCENYFAFHGYYNKWKPVNLIEETFPVAFGILIYHQVDQFEQLFRAIYRPNNFYCIHVDDTAKQNVKDMVCCCVVALIF